MKVLLLIIISIVQSHFTHCTEEPFIVISKLELKLYICKVSHNDTIRIAEYPICIGQNIRQKQREGDKKTPESTWEQPFIITEIIDSSQWYHDFNDGRGLIPSYGHWFLRLYTPPFNGIGIHGSTNNSCTVPGRYSEGCIRLLDEDIISLKEKYAFVGMKVFIKKEDEGLRNFEKKNTIKQKENMNMPHV